MTTQQERGLATVGPRTISDPSEEARLTRQLIVKNASDAEFRLLMGICDRYGFDPLLKHVLIVSKNIYVTRDGLLHLAHASGQFNGIAVSVVQTSKGEWVATCTVHRKDMDHPIVYSAFESEHKPRNAKDDSAWAKYPRAMLQKCAEVMALRRAFDVSLGAVEEIGYDVQTGRTSQGEARFVEAAVVESAPARRSPPAPAPADDKFLATVRQMGEDGITLNDIIAFIDSEWDTLGEAAQLEANRLVDAIRVGRKARRKAQERPRAESAPIEAQVVEAVPARTMQVDGDGWAAVVGEPMGEAEHFGWTEFWSWARARGLNSRKELDEVAGKPTHGLTPVEIRKLIAAREQPVATEEADPFAAGQPASIAG